MKTTKKTYIPSKKHEQHLFHGKNLWARHSQAHGLGIYYDEEHITYAGANSSYDGDLTGENQRKNMVIYGDLWWFLTPCHQTFGDLTDMILASELEFHRI